MLKLLGACCLLGGAMYVAMATTHRLRERVDVLAALTAAVGFLQEELSYARTPTNKLLEQLSQSHSDPVGRFFRAVLDALREDPEGGVRRGWDTALDQCLPMLHKEEKETLSALSQTLGRYDVEAQRPILAQTAARLEEYRQEAKADQARLGRVYTAVTLAAGTLAVIVLL